MERTLKKTASEKTISQMQPQEYSPKELAHLKEFIETLKDEDKRSQLVCWGNHDDYTHGY